MAASKERERDLKAHKRDTRIVMLEAENSVLKAKLLVADRLKDAAHRYLIVRVTESDVEVMHRVTKELCDSVDAYAMAKKL